MTTYCLIMFVSPNFVYTRECQRHPVLTSTPNGPGRRHPEWSSLFLNVRPRYWSRLRVPGGGPRAHQPCQVKERHVTNDNRFKYTGGRVYMYNFEIEDFSTIIFRPGKPTLIQYSLLNHGNIFSGVSRTNGKNGKTFLFPGRYFSPESGL